MARSSRREDPKAVQLELFSNDTSDIQGFGEYHTVDTPKAFSILLRGLEQAKVVAVDTETSSTDALTARLVGISIAYQPTEAYYLPVGHQQGLHLGQQLSLKLATAGLAPILRSPLVTKVCHNAKYDLKVLARYGMPVQPPLFDTMVAAWLVESTEHQLGLKAQVAKRLGLAMTTVDHLIHPTYGMELTSIARASKYACADADMTLRLFQVLQEELHRVGAWDLFTQMEMPLLQVLTRMETRGMLINPAFLKGLAESMHAELDDLTKKIWEVAGYPFNVGSSKQLQRVLYRELGLSSGRGDNSTGIEALRAMHGQHPIIELILEHRQRTKLLSTFVEALPEKMHPKTKRVHTTFNQTGTSTGRLSSSRPNLQQIPTRTDLGRQVRGAFIAPRGHLLLSCDYTQIEPRILAHVTQDPKLLATFAAGIDVHSTTAAELFGIPIEEVNYAQRTLAKRIYFGLMYGISDKGMAERTGYSVEQSQRFITAYFVKFSRVKEYFIRVLRETRRTGWASTLLGRRRYFPEMLAGARTPKDRLHTLERAVINMPIQGTAADIMKIAMIGVDRELTAQGLRSRVVLQVHDELLLEVPEDELEATQEVVKTQMEGAFELDAPLKVHYSVGRSWLDSM